MKLKQYLTEEDLRDTLKSQLRKDCAPFFKEIRGVMSPFIFRGTTKSVRIWIIVNRRKNRHPKYISNTLHKWLDNDAKKKWGWKTRSSGIFTSGHISAAEAYGMSRLFCPIGKFRYIWHNDVYRLYDIYDMLSFAHEGESLDFWDEKTMWQYLKRLTMMRNVKDAQNLFIEELKKYKNKNLSKYLNNITRFSEVIFDVDKYYLIDDNPETREILFDLANER